MIFKVIFSICLFSYGLFRTTCIAFAIREKRSSSVPAPDTCLINIGSKYVYQSSGSKARVQQYSESQLLNSPNGALWRCIRYRGEVPQSASPLVNCGGNSYCYRFQATVGGNVAYLKRGRKSPNTLKKYLEIGEITTSNSRFDFIFVWKSCGGFGEVSCLFSLSDLSNPLTSDETRLSATSQEGYFNSRALIRFLA